MLSFWILFNIVIILLLLADLTLINRDGRVVSFRQALLTSAIWVSLALVFALGVHHWMSPVKSLEFVTGYVIEEALSVDNLFVFILLFNYFKVPPEQERTVLFWGILGALVMRGAFIFAGVALVRRLHDRSGADPGALDARARSKSRGLEVVVRTISGKDAAADLARLRPLCCA